MAIDVNVQCNGGFLPDIILFTLGMSLQSGNPTKCHEEVFDFLQPMFPPKRFDTFTPPVWEMLRRFRGVRTFIFKNYYYWYILHLEEVKSNAGVWFVGRVYFLLN